MKTTFAVAVVAVVLGAAAGGAACGARTELSVGVGAWSAGGGDAGTPGAGSDAATPDAPPPLPPPCVPGAPPKVLYAAQPFDAPFAPALAVDDSAVYFIANVGDAGTFASVSKQGGPVTLLAPAPQPNVDQMLVDDENLFAFDYAQGIFRVPKGGGPSVQLTPPPVLGAAGMGIDDSFVYYSDSVDAWKVPKEGGTPTLIAGEMGMVPQNDWILNLRLVGDNLFWTQPDSGFYTCGKDGSDLRLIATLDPYGEANEFVTDGTIAYAWIEPLGPAPQLVSLSVASGLLASITGADGPRGFFEDDALLTSTTVYWTGTAATIAPTDAGYATQGIIALDRATNAVRLVTTLGAAVIDQDDACLYWVDETNLYTVAK